MIKVQTFAVVHDQDLILVQNAHYKNNCENLTWILVGKDKPTDKLDVIPSQVNYIKAETLKYNIEDNKELLHMTAYYAIIKNKLIDKDTTHVRFIEYDMIFSASYKRDCNLLLQYNLQIYCHKELNTNFHVNKPDEHFAIVDDIFRNEYHIDPMQLFRNKKWMVSINFILRVDFFNDFFKFFWKHRKKFIGNYHAGQNVERLFSTYCLHNNINWRLIPYCRHHFCNSHGTTYGKIKVLT